MKYMAKPILYDRFVLFFRNLREDIWLVILHTLGNASIVLVRNHLGISRTSLESLV